VNPAAGPRAGPMPQSCCDLISVKAGTEQKQYGIGWQRLGPFLPKRGIMSCEESARERGAQQGRSSQALRRS